jgi:hypothetical protein
MINTGSSTNYLIAIPVTSGTTSYYALAVYNADVGPVCGSSYQTGVITYRLSRGFFFNGVTLCVNRNSIMEESSQLFKQYICYKVVLYIDQVD